MTMPTEKHLDSLCYLLETKHINADPIRQLYAAHDRATNELAIHQERAYKLHIALRDENWNAVQAIITEISLRVQKYGFS